MIDGDGVMMDAGIRINRYHNLHLPLCMLAFLLFFSGAVFASSGSSIAANVTVFCRLHVSISSNSFYVIGTDASFPYSYNSMGGCTTSELNGSISLYRQPANSLAYYRRFPLPPASGAVVSNTVVVNTSTLGYGNYTAAFNVSYVGYSNESTARFALLLPANIVIGPVQVPQSILQGSQLGLEINETNRGNLSSANDTMNIQVRGPVSRNYSFAVNGLVPGGSGSQDFVLNGVSGATGTYSIAIYMNYTSGGLRLRSNNFTSSYVVFSNQPQQPSTPPPPPPHVEILYAPFYISAPFGQTVYSQIEVKNNGTVGEYINISTPFGYRDIANISSGRGYLAPGEELFVSIAFIASRHVQGVYSVPITVSARSTYGSSYNSTAYYEFYMYNSSSVGHAITEELSSSNGYTDASGIMHVNLSVNSTNLYNYTLMVYIPQAITDSASNIKAYGFPNRIGYSNGYYVISWSIPSIAANNYAYYSISNVTDPYLLEQSIERLEYQRGVSFASSARLVNFVSAPVYTGGNGTINFSFVYTGAHEANVLVSAAAPEGIYIANGAKEYQAAPDSAVDGGFQFVAGYSPGSYSAYINITIGNNTKSYAVTEDVLARQAYTSTTTTIPAQPGVTINYSGFLGYAYRGVLAALGLLIIVASIIKIRSRPVYRKWRVERLEKIKKEMEDGDE